MKVRTDFVTNSSSSSFIITNKTDEPMTARDVLINMFSEIMKDSDEACWYIPPHESVEYECSVDGINKFERFIHNNFGGYSCLDYDVDSSKVEIKFGESHH